MSESMIKALKEKIVTVGDVWSLKPCTEGFLDFLMNGMGGHEWFDHEELLLEEIGHKNRYDQHRTANAALRHFVMDRETITVKLGTILESGLDIDNKWWFIDRMHMISGLFTEDEAIQYVTWVLGLQYPDVFANADLAKRLSDYVARVRENEGAPIMMNHCDMYEICDIYSVEMYECVSRSCRRTTHPLSDWADDATDHLFDLLT